MLHNGEPNVLEQAREENGSESCEALFRKTLQEDQEKALHLLDSRELSYPCLIALLAPIREHGLMARLEPVLAAALQITLQIEGKTGGKDYLSIKSDLAHRALRWMVETGGHASELDSACQKALDIAVSVLIHTYRDIEILPTVAKMIFERRRRGDNVHDLIWAFFRIRDPRALRLIAEKLPGADPKEAEFIRDLLGVKEHKGFSLRQQTREYLEVLEASSKKLRFREENKQYMSRPVVCKLEMPDHTKWRLPK